MKLGIITDIHNNLTALKTVTEKLNQMKCDKIYINVGSLGCPAQDKNIARGGIADIENGIVEIQPIDIKYDVNPIINRIDTLNYPDAVNIKKYFYGIWS